MKKPHSFTGPKLECEGCGRTLVEVYWAKAPHESLVCDGFETKKVKH